MDKKKFNLVYKNFAIPIFNMTMVYENSAFTIENKVVNPKVVNAFNELKKALEAQLNEYR